MYQYTWKEKFDKIYSVCTNFEVVEVLNKVFKILPESCNFDTVSIATANPDTRVSTAVTLMNARPVTMFATQKPCVEIQWAATTVLATAATKAQVTVP